MQKEDFLKENGLLLSKFEEVQGHFLLLKSQIRSQAAEIDGLKYDQETHVNEIERLKKANRQLREKVSQMEAKISEQSILVPQNFKIKNNLVKIVSDIEEKGSMQEVNLIDYLDALIEEIDICINQLSK
jgi:regulator of replication initiation timing